MPPNRREKESRHRDGKYKHFILLVSLTFLHVGAEVSGLSSPRSDIGVQHMEMLDPASTSKISINGIFFVSELNPGFNQQDFKSNFINALNSGYNRIYIGSYISTSGVGDVLISWKNLSNQDKKDILNLAAEKNAKLFLYASGDDIQGLIQTGKGQQLADGAISTAQDMGLQGVMFDIRIPNYLYPYLSVYVENNIYASNTTNFLNTLVESSQQAFPENLCSHRIESAFLGQWSTDSANSLNFPTLYGKFISENYQKFENVVIDYYWNRSPEVQIDEKTLFLNSSTLTNSDKNVQLTGMTDLTQTAINEILANQLSNSSIPAVFTIGKPLPQYSNVQPNDLACWRNSSSLASEGIIGYVTWPYDQQDGLKWPGLVETCVNYSKTTTVAPPPTTVSGSSLLEHTVLIVLVSLNFSILF